MNSSYYGYGKFWKNKGGTSPLSCRCGSWKNHWMNGTGESWPRTCSVDGCNNPAEVGGHIVSASDGRGDVYIVPMCTSCNSAGTSRYFRLKPDRIPISANKQNTCSQW